MKTNRRQRRQMARDLKLPFNPKYNGKSPVRDTNYEKFNSKYVTIIEVESK